MKVLVTVPAFKSRPPIPALERLREFAEVTLSPGSRPLSEEELIPLLQGCDGLLAGLDNITGKVLAANPGLRAVSRYGIGVDNVDLDTAKRLGITVCNTPGTNHDSVADLAMGLMLCLARKIPLLDSRTRAGQWSAPMGLELRGKTIGLLGLGAVGRAMAKRALAFSMRVVAYSPHIDAAYAEANGIEPVSFDRLIAESDIISLHLPIKPETRLIINREAMLAMKPGAIIINTARGGLIDETAAYELLKAGQLGGLGTDVFELEPAVGSPLFELENVVVTPHIGSFTTDATCNMANASVQNMIDVLSGRACGSIIV